MKNAPDLTKAKPKKVAAPAIAKTVSRSRAKPIAGARQKYNVRGRQVEMTLRVVPAADIAEKTRVWGNNERLQDRLTEAALDDILPTMRDDGQAFPAIGRDVDGTLEVADGSRRRAAAILAPTDYMIWVGDLDDADMNYLTEIGNDYRPTSAYEKGRRYRQLLDSKIYSSQRDLAEKLGIERRVVSRCMETSALPDEVINLFPILNDISARAGERLSKAKCKAMVDFALSVDMENRPDSEALIAQLLASAEIRKETPKPAWSDDDWSINVKRGGALSVEIGAAVPEKLRHKIQRVIEKELNF